MPGSRPDMGPLRQMSGGGGRELGRARVIAGIASDVSRLSMFTSRATLRAVDALPIPSGVSRSCVTRGRPAVAPLSASRLLGHSNRRSRWVLRASVASWRAQSAADVADQRTQAQLPVRILPSIRESPRARQGLAQPGNDSWLRNPGSARHVERPCSTRRRCVAAGQLVRQPVQVRDRLSDRTGHTRSALRSIGCTRVHQRSGSRRRRGMIDRPTMAVRESSWAGE